MLLMLPRVLALQAGEGAEEAETGCLQMGATSLYGGSRVPDIVEGINQI